MPIFHVNRISFLLLKFIRPDKQQYILKWHTFASICGGPGAFGVFDDDIEPDKLEFVDPNVLVDVEFNADEITLEFGELLKQYDWV